MARIDTSSGKGQAYFCQACGLFTACIGLMVIVGWYAHWASLVQVLSGLVPMKFNTALSFVLCGAGLFLLTLMRPRIAFVLGILVTAIGTVTTLEYLANWQTGLDELFFKYYVILPSETSPRMAPLSSACFIFLGLALALLGAGGRTKVRVTLAGMLACIVAVIAIVALLGYIFKIESAYGWGSSSRIALHTAVNFLLLSAGLLAWASRMAREDEIDFLRWLPVAASFTLITMIGFTSAVSFKQLVDSAQWRKHSYDVMNTAQSFISDVFDIQRGMRSYAYTGSPISLEIYQTGLLAAPEKLAGLRDLTQDNPSQEENLKAISADLDQVTSYASELIALRQEKGANAVMELEKTGRGFGLANEAMLDTHTFMNEERRLLDIRSAAVDAGFHNTGIFLGLGSVLAAALLLMASLMASREMRLRRRAEAKQREIVVMQRGILNSADYAIISTSSTGVVTSFNSTAEKWLGYSAAEVIGETTPAIWHDHAEVVKRAAEMSRELGRRIEPGFETFVGKVQPDKPQESEWTYHRRDGGSFRGALSATGLYDESGKLTGYLGMISDVTERRAVEKKLKDQALILDLVNDTIFVRDMNDRIIYWNHGAQRLYGWTKEEAEGRITHTLFSTRFPQPLDEIKRQLLAVGRWEGELEHTRHDHSMIIVASSWTLQRDEAGKPISVIELNYDITSRKKAERALYKSEERLKAILSGSIDGVIVYEAMRDEEDKIKDFRFAMVNPAAEKMMGLKAADVIGQTLFGKFPTAGDRLMENFKKIVDENVTMDFEHESRRFEPPRWYRLAGVKLGDGIALSYTEITARKQFEKELQEAKERAESSDRAKSEFLAIMSHEIRTPMNGVIGMTSILADTELTDLQRDCVSTISTSGESLLTVINDILDFSKIESGRMHLETRSFHLERCIEEAVDLFAAPIRIKGLEAVYLVAPEIPAHLMGDSLRLRQILVNLLGNAIKFTAKGEIAIQVELKGHDENGYHLQFAITDTGIGISREGLDKLFKAFQQVDTSTTRRYGGTGLGLVISKRLAEFMGGSMWVESEPGVGSTFFFSVVLKTADSADPEHLAPEPGALASQTVLIVDDNTTNRRILEIQLKIWGMTPTSAASAAEGLAILKEKDFDVGLIDLQMPEMDGVTLSREMKRHKSTPLILLSSSGEIITGDDANLFQIQIPKPIKHSHLFNALLRITGITPRQPQKPPEKNFDKEMGKQNPLRILLAEDNTVNQKVGLLMLARLGYTADLASNGKQALKAIEKSPYDLILMDIQMPDMNGIEASRLIRERLGEKCPTIYALTAEALEGDKQRFLNLGFDGYLSKPLQATALTDALKSVKMGTFPRRQHD